MFDIGDSCLFHIWGHRYHFSDLWENIQYLLNQIVFMLLLKHQQMPAPWQILWPQIDALNTLHIHNICLSFIIWGHFVRVSACSSGISTNHINVATLECHVADTGHDPRPSHSVDTVLGLKCPCDMMLNVRLAFITTHFHVLGLTRTINQSLDLLKTKWTLHKW